MWSTCFYQAGVDTDTGPLAWSRLAATRGHLVRGPAERVTAPSQFRRETMGEGERDQETRCVVYCMSCIVVHVRTPQLSTPSTIDLLCADSANTGVGCALNGVHVACDMEPTQDCSCLEELQRSYRDARLAQLKYENLEEVCRSLLRPW